MAGDDADLPMLAYPTAIQETLDLCIDVTVSLCGCKYPLVLP